MKPIACLLALYLVFIIYSCQQDREFADLIVVNGSLWTGDDLQPVAESMAIRDGVILAVGRNEEISEWQSASTEMFDAGGKMIVPGFIDCHVHFFTGGFALASVQLRDAKTPEEFSSRIAKFGETTDGWITGGDWDHEQWGGELPAKEWIDEYTAEIPVFVRRLDGHMGLANSKAMELAGIDADTPDVEGGEIVRDAQGNPTGIFKDNAMGLVGRVIPSPTDQQYAQALRAAMEYVSSLGVTSVHHVGATEAHLDAIRTAMERGDQFTRIYALTPLSEWRSLTAMMERDGPGDEWLKLGGLKGFVDGSLGSHTAAFLEPYTDSPADRGIYINPKDSLRAWVTGADEAGLQVAVHAIGDEAIRFILDVYQQATEQNGPGDKRFRIEHAQHIDPEDYSRFAEIGVVPSMQPYHAIDDGRWAEKVIGADRIQSTYAFRSLLDHGASVAFGSDWFVAPPDPLYGIYAAVTRQTLDGANPDGWVPEQQITVEEALKAYTASAAYASFDEDVKGSLAKGKLADFVILSANLLEIDPTQIKDVEVLQTFVDGRRVYESQ